MQLKFSLLFKAGHSRYALRTMATKNQRDITVICRQSAEPCEEALRAAFAMLFHIGPDEQLPPAPPAQPGSADLTVSDEELTFKVITNH